MRSYALQGKTMYRGFNLTLDEHVVAAFSAYQAAGAAFMAAEWPRIAPDLSTLISKDVIDGERTMQGWFASVDANVFISHSHADKGLAIGLAGFLRQELGLRPFVDSLVWGNSSELLWEFDNLHCKPAGATTLCDATVRSKARAALRNLGGPRGSGESRWLKS